MEPPPQSLMDLATEQCYLHWHRQEENNSWSHFLPKYFWCQNTRGVKCREISPLHWWGENSHVNKNDNDACYDVHWQPGWRMKMHKPKSYQIYFHITYSICFYFLLGHNESYQICATRKEEENRTGSFEQCNVMERWLWDFHNKAHIETEAMWAPGVTLNSPPRGPCSPVTQCPPLFRLHFRFPSQWKHLFPPHTVKRINYWLR